MKTNHVSIDQISDKFKGMMFKAINMYDVIEGSVSYYTIIFKERGKGYQWKYMGKNSEILKYANEKDAKNDARKLNEWSSK